MASEPDLVQCLFLFDLHSKGFDIFVMAEKAKRMIRVADM